MILSKDIPEKIDVFEYLLPKLQLMTMPPSFEGDKRLPEVRFINFLQELSIDSDKIKESLIPQHFDLTLFIST